MPRIRVTYSADFPEDLIEHTVTTDFLGWATKVERPSERVIVAQLGDSAYETAKAQLTAWQSEGILSYVEET